jgi:hypothetical protein
MSKSDDQVRPDTRTLKRLVESALAQQRPSYHGTEPCALLVLEPNCIGLPSALILDSVLEPVDKLIWLALMVFACRGDGVTLVPAYRELAKSVNVASRQTASRSLSILRCRRWLTVCHTSWRKDGQRRGSAYALHATPLPIVDTIYLDPRYLVALEDLAGQQQGRVCNIAANVLAQISPGCSTPP